MASPTGGQFVFSKGTQTVHLGLSQNGAVPTATNAGTDYNIEVFVNANANATPTLAAGFNAGVVVTDSVGALLITGATGQELLGGQKLTLFTGDYEVINDPSVVSGVVDQPAAIQGGSGNQTLVGATGDTILGGSGAQVLDSGNESIVGGSGPETIFGAFGDTIIAGSGNTLIFGAGNPTKAGGMRITVGTGSATDTIFGSLAGGTPDSLFGGSANAYVQALGKGDLVNFANETGNSTIQAGAGNIAITLGGGASTVFGGAGDSVVAGAGSAYIDGSAGGQRITAGSAGGNDTIFGSTKAGSGGAADTLFGGAASVVVSDLGKGDIVNFTGQSGQAVIGDYSGGNAAIVLGSGSATVFGHAGDSITGGTGNAVINGSAGGMQITVGTAGTEIITGSFAGSTGDTIIGGAAAVTVGAAGGDVLKFGSQTGDAQIDASKTTGIAVTLGGGTATVHGGAGDTVNFGSVGQLLDDNAGGSTITLGTAGTDTVFGSGKAGSPDTIIAGTGQNANLLFNPGSTLGGGETINLAGHTGKDVINAYQFVVTDSVTNKVVSSTDFATNDTIIAGNGSNSIWGGGGDRIGVGDTTGSASHGTVVGGTHIWSHSDTTAGSAVQFGSNDTVVAVTYDTVGHKANINATAGGSTAQITVGIVGDTTTQFNTATDKIFYANEGAGTDAQIRATAVTANGNTLLTLPDATQITLVGVTDPTKINFTK